MKKHNKIIFGSILSLFAVIGLSSCTKSFCSNVDTGRVLFAFDPGTTTYIYSESAPDIVYTDEDTGYTYTLKNALPVQAEFDDGDHKFYYPVDSTMAAYDNPIIPYTGVNYLNVAIANAYSNGYVIPTSNQVEYFRTMDKMVLKTIMAAALRENKGDITTSFPSYDENDPSTWDFKFKRDVAYFGYTKFVKDDANAVWQNWNDNDAAIIEAIGLEHCLSTDFKNYYKSYMTSNASNYRTCLATRTDKYGSYGYASEGIYVEAKTWSYAWSKGFFEGLLVYPIGWLIDQIGIGFKNAGSTSGVAALLAIFFVTLIVRGLMMIVTIKQTKSSAKMTELQPEITKIQNKYPNSNTNKYEKQRMAEEMNTLYKKNKINPLSTLLVLIVQFPVFICVWGALSGSSILTTGEVLGLNLATSIKDALFDSASWGGANGYAGVTALFLFLFMAAAQAVSMLLPQWMQKAKAKKVAKLGKNPAQKSQDNKMKWVTYIMLAVIIFMGFSLVSAMGVYWLVGALISIGQTLVMQVITNRKKKH